MGLKSKLHNLKEKYKGKKMAPAFNALHTFLYTPNETTHSGSHVRAGDDLKRTMNTVILFSYLSAQICHEPDFHWFVR